MKPKRHITTADRPAKDERGNRACRWCRGPVKPPRRTYCSAECVHEFNLRASGGYLRYHVEQRDKGICAACGLDTIALRRKYDALYRWLLKRQHVGFRRLRRAFLERHSIPYGRQDSDWWDADHVVPVEDGGGECGLPGYQTLCIPCHKRKTARQAREKAERRRGQVALEIEA